MGDSGATSAVPETASTPSEGRVGRGFSRVRTQRVPASGAGRRRRVDDGADGGADGSDGGFREDDLELDHGRDHEHGQGRAPNRPEQAGRGLRPRELGPWLIALPFFAVYSLLSILRYERRETMSWDLGIFTQAVRQYAHLNAPIVDIRGQGLDLLGDHFHPIIATLAPFFALFPTPVTLLLGQAFLCAVAAVPITRTAMQLIGRRAGYAIGVAYGLSWGIVSAVNFDFHELVFAVPLLAFSLCAYLRGEDTKALLWALPLLLVKEDIAPYAFVIAGMVLHRRYRHDVWMRRAAMVGGIFAGIAVFFLLIKFVIPHFNTDHVYLYWDKGGCIDPKNHNGLGKLVSCSTQQELNGLGIKERTLFLTAVPTAFLALRSPITLLLLPTFALRFLNPSDNYWGTDYHYSAVPMVVVFVAAIDGLLRIQASRERRLEVGSGAASDGAGSGTGQRTILQAIGDVQLRHGAAMMLAAGVALTMSFPLQDLLNSDTYKITDRAHALQHAEAQVPDDVSVETTINMLAPLAARTHAYWVGFANNTPAPEYVAIDLGPQDWNGLGSALALVEQRHPGITWAQVYKDPTMDVYVFKQAGGAAR